MTTDKIKVKIKIRLVALTCPAFTWDQLCHGWYLMEMPAVFTPKWRIPVSSLVPEPTIENAAGPSSGNPPWAESVQTHLTKNPAAWISTVLTTSTTLQVKEGVLIHTACYISLNLGPKCSSKLRTKQ